MLGHVGLLKTTLLPVHMTSTGVSKLDSGYKFALIISFRLPLNSHDSFCSVLCFSRTRVPAFQQIPRKRAMGSVASALFSRQQIHDLHNKRSRFNVCLSNYRVC